MMFHSCGGARVAPQRQYRSKGRLWSWIHANVRLDIEVHIVVGADDLHERHGLRDAVRVAISRALPAKVYERRTSILVCEQYANGYLLTYGSRSEMGRPASPTSALRPLSPRSLLRACVVRGPGSSSRTIERYRAWRRRIIRGLAEEFGAGFVDQVGEGDPADLPGENLASVPMTPDEEESAREMMAGLASYKIDEEPW